MPLNALPTVLLRATKEKNLQLMNAEMRKAGGWNGLSAQQQDLMKSICTAETEADVDFFNLFTAWRITGVLDLPTDDEHLRESFKAARQISNRLPELTNGSGKQLHIVPVIAGQEIEGVRSIYFAIESFVIQPQSNVWKLLEEENECMENFQVGSTQRFTRMLHSDKMLMEMREYASHDDGGMEHFATGLVHWEFQSGSMARHVKKMHSLKPGIQAVKCIREWRNEESESDCGHQERILKEFLSSGINIDDPLMLITSGDRLLRIAVENNNLPAIELLINAGASKSRNPSEQKGLLSTVISSSSPCGKNAEATLRLLLSMGVPMEEPNDKGTTPLMLACEDGKPNMASILLAAGASLDLRDAAGRSAVDLSSQEPRSHRGESCKPLIDAHLAAIAVNEIISAARKSNLPLSSP